MLKGRDGGGGIKRKKVASTDFIDYDRLASFFFSTNVVFSKKCKY